MTTLTKPTIHLNGTSRGELERQYEEAGHALQAALTALMEAAPNGRDYYPQGDTAIYAAQREHVARLKAVDTVLKEVRELYDAIAE